MPHEIEALLDDLDSAVGLLLATVDTDDVDEIRRRTEPVLASARALGDALPNDLKKGPFRNLQRHVRFVGLYADRNDLRMVSGNIRSLRPDTLALRGRCASIIPPRSATGRQAH